MRARRGLAAVLRCCCTCSVSCLSGPMGVNMTCGCAGRIRYVGPQRTKMPWCTSSSTSPSRRHLTSRYCVRTARDARSGPPCTQTLADAGILILTRFCVCRHPTAGRSVQMLPDRRQTGHRLRVDGGVGMTPPACYTGTASENTMAKLRSISKLLLDSKHGLIEVQTNVFIRVEVSNASRRPTISWRC